MSGEPQVNIHNISPSFHVISNTYSELHECRHVIWFSSSVSCLLVAVVKVTEHDVFTARVHLYACSAILGAKYLSVVVVTWIKKM